MAQYEVLVRIAVRPDVGLETAPRNRREGDDDVSQDAAVLRVDLVLVDVEVGVIEFHRRRRSAGSHSAPDTGGSEVVLRVVGLLPKHQADEGTEVSLVHLVVGGRG